MAAPAAPTPETAAIARRFWSEEQLRLNARRLEHLATLGLDLEKKRVLEVGGGMGDLTRFFLDRGCRVLLTDARPKNLRAAMIDGDLAQEARLETERLDLDSPGSPKGRAYDVGFCYGVLHLLQRPERSLDFLAKCCGETLLLECEVSDGAGAGLGAADRPQDEPMGSLRGRGSRFGEAWLVGALRSRFKHVYRPRPPCHHPSFSGVGERRTVLVAAHRGLSAPALQQA